VGTTVAVLMQLGTTIICEAGALNEPNDVADLTRRCRLGLRAVTLNFRSTDEARSGAFSLVGPG
jgi:hypothetical protein